MNLFSLSKCTTIVLLMLIVMSSLLSCGLGEPGLLGSSLPIPNLNPSSIYPDLSKIQEQLSKMGSLSDALEKAVEAEKSARLKLQEFVDNVKDRIEALENAALPDETSYWEESTSCGGVIVAQTGRIIYKLDTSYDSHEKCVWTIRANHRSLVKVNLIAHGLEPGFSDLISVTEVKQDGREPQTFRLERKGKYVFDGPLLLITFTTDGSMSGTGFSLEFEGVGRNINQDVTFKHYHINDASGTFSTENLTMSDSSIFGGNFFPALRNPTLEFTSIVLNPNIRNATQLSVTVNEEQLNIQPNECDKASLTFYDYFWIQNQNNTSMRTRCCGTGCEEGSTFKNDDGISLVTMRKKISLPQPESTFNFTWNARGDIPKSDSVDTCGGIISGRHGRISYKADKAYENNDRCVWSIRPNGKSRIKVILHSQDIEHGYDYVAASTVSEDGHLKMHTIKMKNGFLYDFSGPIILITFYSDDATEGKGFELDWEEFGDPSRPTNDAVHFSQDSGTVSLSLESPTYQVVVINPKYLDGSALNLKINSLESQPKQNNNPSECNDLLSGIYVYGNDEDNFTLAQKYCEVGEEVPEEFGAIGSIFILLVKLENPDSVTKLELTWKKGSPPIKPDLDKLKYVTNVDECGNILIGDVGHIQYHLTSQYEDLSRCTWVIESIKLSKISLKLIKDGFESCCDFLVATPLNVDDGTLGESLIINRENRVRSFTSPVVFVTFYSDTSLGYQGFKLEFTTNGHPIDEVGRTRFSHNIWREAPGSFTFSMEENLIVEDSDDISNQTKMMVTNILNTNMSGIPLKPITINVQTNEFQVNELCNRDRLSFFQIRYPDYSTTFSEESVGCTIDDKNNSCTCSPQTKTFTMQDNYFILIFKPLESNDKASFNFNWTFVEDPAAAT